MKYGYLYEKEEKEVKKDIEKGIEVYGGVDINSLLDTINLLEINNPSNPEITLSLIKKECMIYLGKLEEVKKWERKMVQR